METHSVNWAFLVLYLYYTNAVARPERTKWNNPHPCPCNMQISCWIAKRALRALRSRVHINGSYNVCLSTDRNKQAIGRAKCRALTIMPLCLAAAQPPSPSQISASPSLFLCRYFTAINNNRHICRIIVYDMWICVCLWCCSTILSASIIIIIQYICHKHGQICRGTSQDRMKIWACMQA